MATWKKLLMSGLDLNTSTDITNNHIGVTDGTNSTDITLGNDITFVGGGDISVTESSGTITISFSEQSAANAFTSFAGDSGDVSTPDTTTDTITFEGGSGITTVAGGADDKITFNLSTIGSLTVLGNTNAGADTPQAVAIDTDLTSVSADHDTLASAKAIKAAIDAVDVELGLEADSGSASTVTTSQTLTIAGTANEIETSVSGQTITVGLPDNVTITGNLTVQGTTTTIESTTLTVQDKDAVLAYPDVAYSTDVVGNAAAVAGATDGGILVTSHSGTDTANFAGVTWDPSAQLTGWQVRDTAGATDHAIAVMHVTTAAPDDSTNDLAGIGSLWVDTTGDSLYIRVD